MSQSPAVLLEFLNMEITWTHHLRTSALHAAHALAGGAAIVDDRLAAALAAPAQRLAGEIKALRLPEECFWRNLIPLSATIPGRLTRNSNRTREGQRNYPDIQPHSHALKSTKFFLWLWRRPGKRLA